MADLCFLGVFCLFLWVGVFLHYSQSCWCSPMSHQSEAGEGDGKGEQAGLANDTEGSLQHKAKEQQHPTSHRAAPSAPGWDVLSPLGMKRGKNKGKGVKSNGNRKERSWR